MSNLLEQASLVMIPSGYKEDVVYSEIPINGAGDLAFTRASNGTRINSQGLVEVVPWNLFQQSENFPNAIWTKSTLTFNSTVTAPNGTSTAQNYSTAGAYSYVLQTITVSSGEYYTVSCYLKYTSGVGSISIGYTDAPSNNFIRVDANLINGTIGSVSYGGNGANGTATITSVGDGWYRVTVSGTLTIGNAGLIVSNLALGATTFSIWGAQLNIGSTAKPYFPTTDRLNVPRLTYQNGGGGCPSLLLEKQSTNLQIRSEQFDLWSTTSDLSVTANNTTSPDGTQNADKLNENSSNGYHIIGDSNITLLASTVYTSSFFAKASERSYARMLAPASNYASQSAYFDLTNGNCSATAGTVSTQSMGNGWYRCIWSLTTLPSVSGGIGMWFGPARNMTDAYNTYTGTSGSGIFAWGAQIEQSSYATSLINTTSSSATRVADACLKSGIGSLIGQTSGSVFFDFTVATISAQTNDPVLWYMKDGGSGERYVELYSNGNLQYVEFNGVVIASIIKTGLTVGRHKCAIAYATNDFVFYVDGVQIGTDTSGTPSGFSTFGLQYYNATFNGEQKVNQCALFPTRLTNAELASLTTL